MEHSPKIQAIAFDMDGLLLNTEHLYDVVINDLLSTRGQSFTRETKLAMMGRGAQPALKILKERHNLTDDWTSLAQEIESRLIRILPDKLGLMPGVQILLDKIKQCDRPAVVVTSSPRSFAVTALRQVDILERFEFLVCGEDVEQGKPAPDIYLKAAEKLGVPPHQILALEDSHTGSHAAVAAGFHTIAVPGEHSTDQNFSHVVFVAQRINDPRIMAQLSAT
ncbi:MAG: HAD family phosphatase, partial [Planctomycetota bacterium]|nr:HAD family phosphatase [Planctomycetota bacterium]